jgi:hypothetical protein
LARNVDVWDCCSSSRGALPLALEAGPYRARMRITRYGGARSTGVAPRSESWPLQGPDEKTRSGGGRSWSVAPRCGRWPLQGPDERSALPLALKAGPYRARMRKRAPAADGRGALRLAVEARPYRARMRKASRAEHGRGNQTARTRSRVNTPIGRRGARGTRRLGRALKATLRSEPRRTTVGTSRSKELRWRCREPACCDTSELRPRRVT